MSSLNTRITLKRMDWREESSMNPIAKLINSNFNARKRSFKTPRLDKAVPPVVHLLKEAAVAPGRIWSHLWMERIGMQLCSQAPWNLTQGKVQGLSTLISSQVRSGSRPRGEERGRGMELPSECRMYLMLSGNQTVSTVWSWILGRLGQKIE